jgi:hypothetical protein
MAISSRRDAFVAQVRRAVLKAALRISWCVGKWSHSSRGERHLTRRTFLTRRTLRTLMPRSFFGGLRRGLRRPLPPVVPLTADDVAKREHRRRGTAAAATSPESTDLRRSQRVRFTLSTNPVAAPPGEAEGATAQRPVAAVLLATASRGSGEVRGAAPKRRHPRQPAGKHGAHVRKIPPGRWRTARLSPLHGRGRWRPADRQSRSG